MIAQQPITESQNLSGGMVATTLLELSYLDSEA
jgi:hypothetical protein